MNDDVLQLQAIEPMIPVSEFVPDPALDALYRQAVAVAREFGWPVPARAEFEKKFRQEIAAPRKNHEKGS